MVSNLFGKIFKHTVLFLIVVELFSLLTYVFSPLSQVAFFIVLIIALVLALIKPEYGLYILLAELFVGGHGYLFSLDIGGFTLSIRMGLFLMVLGIWVIKRIKNQESRIKVDKKFLLPTSYFLPPTSYLLLPTSLLFITVLIGLINGLLHNQFLNTLLDFNAWLYFALVFVFIGVVKNKKTIKNILQVLTGATTYLALKTIGVLFLFSHNITGIGGIFYKWIRDTGVGEITYISGTIFRVFFQSQLYCLIGFFIVLIILLYNFKLKNWKNYLGGAIYLYLASVAVIISQSRSFWVGGVAGLIGLIIFVMWPASTRLGGKFNFRIKKTAILIIVLAIMFVDQTFFIKILTNNFSGNLVSDRFRGLQTEAAGISRLNQLEPLTYNILEKPLFGYGFGKELTYQSQDPRILKTHPDGVYTTYAFEWGYLDIWLKIGLLGLLAYGLLIGILFYQGIKNYELRIMNIGLLVGLIALIVTNIFSPYLNHPLGIGYVMLVTAIIIRPELKLHDI